MPSPDQQNTSITLMHPVEAIELNQCSTVGGKNTLFFLNLRFDYLLNSPLQYPGIVIPSKAEKLEHTLCSPLFKYRHHYPWLATPEAMFPIATQCCRGVSTKTALQLPGTQGGSQPCHEKLSIYLGDFALAVCRVPNLCFLIGRCVNGVEELLEVFFPASNNIPS